MASHCEARAGCKQSCPEGWWAVPAGEGWAPTSECYCLESGLWCPNSPGQLAEGGPSGSQSWLPGASHAWRQPTLHPQGGPPSFSSDHWPGSQPRKAPCLCFTPRGSPRFQWPSSTLRLALHGDKGRAQPPTKAFRLEPQDRLVDGCPSLSFPVSSVGTKWRCSSGSGTRDQRPPTPAVLGSVLGTGDAQQSRGVRPRAVQSTTTRNSAFEEDFHCRRQGQALPRLRCALLVTSIDQSLPMSCDH